MSDSPPLMDAAVVATIAATVTALTQVIKKSVPGDLHNWGPLIAAVLAALGVALWVISAPTFPPARTDVWAIASAWVAVFFAAVGAYETAKMVTATPSLRNRSRRVVPVPPPPPATDDTPPLPVTRTRPRPAPSEDLR